MPIKRDFFSDVIVFYQVQLSKKTLFLEMTGM